MTLLLMLSQVDTFYGCQTVVSRPNLLRCQLEHGTPNAERQRATFPFLSRSPFHTCSWSPSHSSPGIKRDAFCKHLPEHFAGAAAILDKDVGLFFTYSLCAAIREPSALCAQPINLWLRNRSVNRSQTLFSSQSLNSPPCRRFVAPPANKLLFIFSLPLIEIVPLDGVFVNGTRRIEGGQEEGQSWHQST